MFCTNCGIKLDDNAKFCSECGFQVLKPVVFETEDEFEFVSSNDTVTQNNPINANNKSSGTRNTISTISRPTPPYIVKTMIVGNDSRKSATSSIVRGAIGGVLLGPVGFVGGAISGKNKKDTTFLLIYNNGVKKTVTVKTNGFLFKQYVKYLEY